MHVTLIKFYYKLFSGILFKYLLLIYKLTLYIQEDYKTGSVSNSSVYVFVPPGEKKESWSFVRHWTSAVRIFKALG
jgi:hypothetical protein